MEWLVVCLGVVGGWLVRFWCVVEVVGGLWVVGGWLVPFLVVGWLVVGG